MSRMLLRWNGKSWPVGIVEGGSATAAARWMLVLETDKKSLPCCAGLCPVRLAGHTSLFGCVVVHVGAGWLREDLPARSDTPL